MTSFASPALAASLAIAVSASAIPTPVAQSPTQYSAVASGVLPGAIIAPSPIRLAGEGDNRPPPPEPPPTGGGSTDGSTSGGGK
jgi:hypothetical protein